MRSVIGVALLMLGAAGMVFIATLPAGYAPWGVVAAPASCAAVIGGARLVRW